MDKPMRTRRRLRMTLGVLVAFGLLLLVGRLQTPPHPKPANPTGTATSIVARSTAPTAPTTSKAAVAQPTAKFDEPITALAVTPGAVWVAHGQTISRIDPKAMRPAATVRGWQPVGNQQLVGMSAGVGAVWASVRGAGLLRIDPATARVTARIPVHVEGPVAVGAGGVWGVCCGVAVDTRGPVAGQLLRVDPATNRVTATIRLPGWADAVGAGPGGVWVRGTLGPIWRVDPTTNRVSATVAVPGGLGTAAGGVLVGRVGVWVSDPDHVTVYQVDPRRARLLGGRFEANGSGLAEAADGTAWVRADRLRLIGLRGQAPVRTLFVDESAGKAVTALATGPTGAGMWAATDTGTLVHLDPRAAS